MQFAAFNTSLSFHPIRSDSSLFVLRRGDDMALLLLYVDDMVLSASTDALLRRLISQLQAEFTLKDMGPLHFLLGVDVRRTTNGFFLSQAKYVEDFLERAGMSNCKPISAPVDTKPKLFSISGAKLTDPTSYSSMAGALQYLTMTRPDIA